VQQVKSALISVYHKDGLEPIVRHLHSLGVKLYSTGGTQSFLEGLGLPVTAVETVTGFPSILDGRVKTLHPMVFGGILWRRDRKDDQDTVERFGIPSFDMVIVDLYPFEDTVASGASEEDIIEKIDIGGISLIRAAAKNFDHCWIVSSRAQYAEVLELLKSQGGTLTRDQRKAFAGAAFQTSQNYDAHIA
jgi:phosphoribosylaminoimidazolecarboxamide formyltransferase/IMP cyclohydrolase